MPQPGMDNRALNESTVNQTTTNPVRTITRGHCLYLHSLQDGCKRQLVCSWQLTSHEQYVFWEANSFQLMKLKSSIFSISLIPTVSQFYAAAPNKKNSENNTSSMHRDNRDVIHLTVKLRQRRCQDDERHSNGYHGDNPIVW